MEWKVSNALSRGVERQQLNKILAEIKSAIALLGEQKETTVITASPVTGSSGGYNPSTGETTADPSRYTLQLDGDISGEAKVVGVGTTTIHTELDPSLIGVEEAPSDNQNYWRRNGGWQAVPDAVVAVADIQEEGLVAIVQDPQTYSYDWTMREIEGTVDQIDVADGDAIAGNPVISIADLTDTNTGTFKLLTRDSKGRLEGTVDGSAVDIPYDNTTSGLTASDIQAALDELAARPSGSGGLLSVVKQADESRASTTTATDDTELTISLDTGIYHIQGYIYLDVTSGTNANFYMQPAFSGTGSFLGLRRRYSVTNTTSTTGESLRSGYGAAPSTNITSTSSQPGTYHFECAIEVTAAGVFSLKWAQDTSSATASIVRAGSTITAIKAGDNQRIIDLPLVNPSGETGDMTGWTTTTMGVTAAGSFGMDLPPDGGSYMFVCSPYAIATGSMYQDISLSAYAAKLAEERLEFMACADVGGNFSDDDCGRIIILFLNNLGNEIQRFTYTRSSASVEGRWFFVTSPYLPIPASCSTIRLYGQIIRASGTDNNGHIDNIRAKLRIN